MSYNNDEKEQEWTGSFEEARLTSLFAFADSTPEQKFTWLEEMYEFYAEVQRMRECDEI